MSGISHILNMGRMALYAQQLGLSTTAHNVANVNTEGFSRQRITFATTKPYDSRPGQMGTGVEAAEIKRVFDKFINLQLLYEIADFESLGSQAEVYEQLEIMFSGLSESDLAADLHEFWSAWDDLATHPEGAAERAAVLQTGLQLGVRIRDLYDKLVSLQDQMNESVAIDVGRVNELTSQIAHLNGKITQAEATGMEANDLRDSRDRYLRELAGIIEVQSWENESGMVNILSPGGNPLVMDGSSWELKAVNNDPRQSDIFWTDGEGGDIEITGFITSGSMGGYMNIRDQVIPDIIGSLDDLSEALIWEVNSLHSTSVSLDPFASLTSEARVEDETVLLRNLNDASGNPLAFTDKLAAGELRIWAYDNTGAALDEVVVNVDPDAMTLQDLADEINNAANYPLGVQLLQASIASDGSFTIQGTGGASGVGVRKDDSGALAALGVGTFFSGSGSADLDVASAIKSDPMRVVSAKVLADGDMAPGDNSAAMDISGLRETPLVGDYTLEQQYASIAGDLGVKAAAVYRSSDYQDMVMEQLKNQMSSVSGVNLDEEMLNMMKFQWAYQAAGKLIQEAQEMLYTVLDIVR